jgi:uncharacterized protein involved in exopolysaccharide biosynthesis
VTQLHERPARPRATEQSEAAVVARSILRSWWIIIICGVIAVAVSVGVQTKVQKKTYAATAFVLLSTSNFQQAVAGGFTPTDPLTQKATAIALLTPSRELQAARSAKLPPLATYSINVEAGANSNVLQVIGTTANPGTAAALADAAATQMIRATAASNDKALGAARAQVNEQLTDAKPGSKRPLANELNSFATLEALANQSIQLVQRAYVPSTSSGESRTRVGAIALVLGLILGVAIALLRPRRAIQPDQEAARETD